jgi:hypothetical protein
MHREYPLFPTSDMVLGRSVGFRLSSGVVLRTTSVFDMYWYFAAERQQIFFRRLDSRSPPWTDDPILRAYRFTNVYRASDRASQYLIRNVIYEGEQSVSEVFFRTILFKLFNRIETWQLLKENLGNLAWSSFDLRSYTEILDRATREGRKIYSPAYIIPSPKLGFSKKHLNHLNLICRMMQDGVPQKVAAAKSLEEVYLILRSFPSIGNFLAFQFAIDLNYSEIVNFSEMDYVVAGPGARSGIRRAFHDLGGLTDEELIREITQAAGREFRERGLHFRDLWGRDLQLIDCQNLFCEIDKYARVALPANEIGIRSRKRIKRRYLPQRVYDKSWYPPKWGLHISP